MKMEKEPMRMEEKTVKMDHGVKQYRLLLIMTVLSFVSMYGLMYAMVNSRDNVFASFNQVYMAALMTAPMVVMEVLIMKSMYGNQRWNAAIVALAGIGAIASFCLIRQQAGISDRQFLRSMIPHHAGAILMCEKASLNDARIKELCSNILANQRAEIAQMKLLLND